MAKVGYDPTEGYDRLAQAVKQVDERALQVLAYHAALEAELDHILAVLLPRGERVQKLGFGQKVRVLEAAWIGDPSASDKVCAALNRFNDLRNAVAHHDRSQIDACLLSLKKAFREMSPSSRDDVSIQEIAQGICAFIGDEPSPAEVKAVGEAIGDVVSRYAIAFQDLKFPEIPKITTPKIELPVIPPIKLG